jgi:hypothetical protein
MTYPAIPDRHMPYDNDGTVVLQREDYPITGQSQFYPTGVNLQQWNGYANVITSAGATYDYSTILFFFPEQREVSALFVAAVTTPFSGLAFFYCEGSNNTTNGNDGTWETATLGTPPTVANNFPPKTWDCWRSLIGTVSFTGPKATLRLRAAPNNPAAGWAGWSIVHVYGQKAAGQTPDDVIFLDQATAYAEFTTDLDFGDRPLGTTSVHQFKVKNASATHTANTINIQCNDADFAISTDGVTYVNTINIASLAAGASSNVLYVRNTTPNPGAALGPRFARIVVTVASYT